MMKNEERKTANERFRELKAEKNNQMDTIRQLLREGYPQQEAVAAAWAIEAPGQTQPRALSGKYDSETRSERNARRVWQFGLERKMRGY